MSEKKERRFFYVQKDSDSFASDEGRAGWLDGVWESEQYEIEHISGGPSSAVDPGTGRYVWSNDFIITDMSQMFKEKILRGAGMYGRLYDKKLPKETQKQVRNANEEETINILFDLLEKENPYVIDETIGEAVFSMDVKHAEDGRKRCFEMDVGKKNVVFCELRDFDKVCRQYISDKVAEEI